MKHGTCHMAVSRKNHFKLSAYLNFRLGRSVDLILNFENFRKFFRKISKFCAKEKQSADGEISLIDHFTMSL
jgi:hypothetical protein